MRNLFNLLLSLLLLISAQASSAKIEKVYLDSQNNVHLLEDRNGKDVKITNDHKASEVSLSLDHRTIAWLIKETEKTDGGVEIGPSKLVIYRDGKARTIQCQPFIRGYWFWKKGSQFAIDCGGEHFAGREILYDTGSLKILESFRQAEIPLEKRPDWSNGDN
jgi:hypothetical protein